MKFVVFAGAAALCVGHAWASAQLLPKDYPNKPIRVVVPHPAGGAPDLVMRLLQPKYHALLGQPLVIDNRSGAGGIVGSAVVIKAPPDGYTWLFNTASHTNTPPFTKNMPFDPVRDFSHVTLVAQNVGLALAVPAKASDRTVQDLIARARQNPGKLNYASAGIGTMSHIPAEVMKAMAGVDIVGVQYKGVSESMTDLLAGRTDLCFMGTNVALPHVQTGRLRVLALTGVKRWKGMPEVPTMEEAGFKGYNLVNWFGLWLPARAAPALMKRLHAETVKALADPDVQNQFEAQGLEGIGSAPEDFAKFVASESAFMQNIARKIEATPK